MDNEPVKRYTIQVSMTTYDIIRYMAKKDKRPVATMTAVLLEQHPAVLDAMNSLQEGRHTQTSASFNSGLGAMAPEPSHLVTSPATRGVMANVPASALEICPDVCTESFGTTQEVWDSLSIDAKRALFEMAD